MWSMENELTAQIAGTTSFSECLYFCPSKNVPTGSTKLHSMPVGLKALATCSMVHSQSSFLKRISLLQETKECIETQSYKKDLKQTKIDQQIDLQKNKKEQTTYFLTGSFLNLQTAWYTSFILLIAGIWDTGGVHCKLGSEKNKVHIKLWQRFT